MSHQDQQKNISVVVKF